MTRDPRDDQADAEAAQKEADERGPAGAEPESGTTPTSPDKSGERIQSADTSKDVGAPPKTAPPKTGRGAKVAQDQVEDERDEARDPRRESGEHDRPAPDGDEPSRPAGSGDGQ